MKIIKIILLIIISIGIQSCKEKVEKTIINKDFTRTYEGHINEKYEIMMKLTSDDGKIIGSYYYKKNSIKLDIKGELQNDGSIVLNEFDTNGNQTGLFKGKMENEQKFVGKWSKPNEKNIMDFKLIESNSNFEISKIKLDYNYITGKYESPHNGSGVSSGVVRILYLGKNKFSFKIFVASNYGNALGEIEETGKIKNGIGYFEKRDCKLTFKFNRDRLEISQKGCANESGMSSFAGEFIKSKLSNLFSCPIGCEKGINYSRPGKCPVCKIDLKKTKIK